MNIEETNKIINWIQTGYTRLNYKEELSLVDYIKQLQKENSRYERINQKYKEVIEKAIKYIESNNETLYTYEPDYDYEENMVDNYDISNYREDLLKILRGGINE